MPVGLTVLGVSSAIGTAGAGIYAAKKKSSSDTYAATLESQAADKQRAYLEAKDAQERADFLGTQQLNLDQYNRREGQLAPYRAQSAASNRTLANWLNLDGQGGASYINDVPPPATMTPSTAPPTAAPRSPEAQFISEYQQSHPVSEGVRPLVAAMKAKGFNVEPYMYGTTPSNNEISLNGEKYKVLGGEGSTAAYWYVPGTNDSGGAPASTARKPFAPFPGYTAPATLADFAARPTAPRALTLDELAQMFGQG